MDDVKKHLLFVIIDFLKTELDSDFLDPLDYEGLDIAKECLNCLSDVPQMKRGEINILEVLKSYRLRTGKGMDDDKKHLLLLIIEFLKTELQDDYLNPDDIEGMEVAIQCLESLSEVPRMRRGEIRLLDVFKDYLSRTHYYIPEPTEAEKVEAESLKSLGNGAMNAYRFNEAVDFYSKAIDINPRNAVYYCNRAAAHSKLNDYMSAIKDCKVAIEIDPQYSKAYGRLGLAYTGLEDYEKALNNYRMATELEPSNEGYKNNFVLAEKKFAESQVARNRNTNGPSNPPDPASVLFGNPQLINIASQMLSDPSMQSMMSTIMSGSLGTEGGMEALLQAGQQLAQHMQAENPGLVDQLRQTLQGATETNRPPQSESSSGDLRDDSSVKNEESSSKENTNNIPDKK